MSIFISIASYEDPDLINTVKSAIDNANNPKNLYFGICLQYKKFPDLSFIPNHQKDIIMFDPENRPGISKVRFLIKSFYKNQDYFLQIDSHSRFLKNWDLILIDNLKKLKEKYGQNSLISSNLTVNFHEGYHIKKHFNWILLNELPVDFFLTNEIEQFTNEDNLKQECVYFKTQYAKGGFIFVDKEIIKNVDFDSYSNCLLEEPLLSFNFIMNGYDIYDVYPTPVIHDNRMYNNHLYKENYPAKSFTSSYKGDSDEDQYEATKAFIYNKGIFSVKNAKRTPKDFWKEIGLQNSFYRVKEKYDKMNIEKGEKNE